MSLGGIVLCGGLSSRFGSSKALLPFAGETMLQRVVRQLAVVASPIAVVAARDQELPPLAPDVMVLRDRQAECGPLEGLRAGLEALQGDCESAYLTGCDYPLLVPAFVRRLHELLGDDDIAIVQVAGGLEPLAAIYRVRLLEQIERLLAASRAGPNQLARVARTRVIAADELRHVDPRLDSLFDIDNPEDYEFALSRVGLAGKNAANPDGQSPP